MASLAEAKFKINDIENVAYFEPYYLKEFMLG
jgi:tRNA threonylcarbamoyladenosine biosynthesis protein TsaB